MAGSKKKSWVRAKGVIKIFLFTDEWVMIYLVIVTESQDFS